MNFNGRKRYYQKDRFTANTSFFIPKYHVEKWKGRNGLFIVCDGHGGTSTCSEIINHAFPHELAINAVYLVPLDLAIRQTLQNCTRANAFMTYSDELNFGLRMELWHTCSHSIEVYSSLRSLPSQSVAQHLKHILCRHLSSRCVAAGRIHCSAYVKNIAIAPTKHASRCTHSQAPEMIICTKLHFDAKRYMG
jgi:hypothetical protein